MIVTSDSVVLRARKQGETSKIITLYTRDYGKLNVIAKGAREMKSKFGASLEMFARVSAIFYKKDKPDTLYLLSKVDMIQANARISTSLERMEAATAAVELIIRAMHDEEENVEIFQALTETLETIAQSMSEAAASLALFRFYFDFARISGFALKFIDDDDIPDSNRSFERRTIFRLSSGELLDFAVNRSEQDSIDQTTAIAGLRVSDEARRILRMLAEPHFETPDINLREPARQELLHLFHAYFAAHLPGFTSRTLRSGNVFSGL